jgi:hypothetical protein
MKFNNGEFYEHSLSLYNFHLERTCLKRLYITTSCISARILTNILRREKLYECLISGIFRLAVLLFGVIIKEMGYYVYIFELRTQQPTTAPRTEPSLRKEE